MHYINFIHAVGEQKCLKHNVIRHAFSYIHFDTVMQCFDFKVCLHDIDLLLISVGVICGLSGYR